MTLRVPARAGDFAIALALAGLGLWWAWLSWNLGLGTAAEPGPGFFPFGVALLMAAGAAGCAVRALAHAPEGEKAGPVTIDAEAIKAGALVAALCLAFTGAGFVAAGFAFMALMLSWVSGRSLVRALVTSAIVVGVFWVLFDRLLGIELPWGVAGDLVDALRGQP